MLSQIDQLTKMIAGYDRQVEKLVEERYPEVERVRQIKGVGALTGLAFVLVLEDASRFRSSRSVGAFLGLTSKKDQSGDSDPQRGITKAGDRLLRRLLIQSAHYILGRFGEDCDLRRHGEKIAERGGKRAKKRATTAVARKLSVLMHRLWVNEEVYEPLRNYHAAMAIQLAA
jgi:transposase